VNGVFSSLLTLAEERNGLVVVVDRSVSSAVHNLNRRHFASQRKFEEQESHLLESGVVESNLLKGVPVLSSVPVGLQMWTEAICALQLEGQLRPKTAEVRTSILIPEVRSTLKCHLQAPQSWTL
jgi:hypothetical protein